VLTSAAVQLQQKKTHQQALSLPLKGGRKHQQALKLPLKGERDFLALNTLMNQVS
jgi:hypothetical protein